MSHRIFYRLGIFLAVGIGIWITIRYLLPVVMPFLMAFLLALAAEPLVTTFHTRLHMKRPLAAGAGVCIVLVLVVLAVLVLGALLIRELGNLANLLPDLGSAASQGVHLLEQKLLYLADQSPAGIRSMVSGSIENLFSGSSQVFDQLGGKLLQFASGVVMALPDSALGLGTWILASFMISAKLPKIKILIRQHIPSHWHHRYFPALRSLKGNLGGWMLAQVKLTGITACVLCIGFLLLHIPHAPLWAVLVSFVDALPVLGTGTVLLPWSLICFLQGNNFQALGLLGIYLCAWLIRSVLEPRLIGRQLGLDPLITLFAMYGGYQLWGLGGMILSPLLAMTAVQVSTLIRSENEVE